ncbi:MAG TPA: biotin--[acetyl-CoA-carboxylase] ligase [Fimbriimonadales bacterium]|nr:biotin--[acetyl-CoA-carboxylase] ligase [Fimbriimonadales bacterium]
MKPVLKNSRGILEVESIDSTQTELIKRVRVGDTLVCAILAFEQTAGRGRFGRNWYSPKDSSLALSFALYDYADWKHPELLGMAVSIAAAKTLDCQIAWPNDLILNGKKLGGVISELVTEPSGKLVPVIGVGANLTVREFPEEIRTFATSLVLEGRKVGEDSKQLAREYSFSLLGALEEIPEPHSFQDLRPLWEKYDCTPGKKYKLPNGRVADAECVSEEGYLIAHVDNQRITVPSAQAWYG